MRRFRVQYFESPLVFSEPIDFLAISYEDAISQLDLGHLIQDNQAAATDLRAILWQVSPTPIKTLLYKGQRDAA
jgi:hypothetical protein